MSDAPSIVDDPPAEPRASIRVVLAWVPAALYVLVIWWLSAHDLKLSFGGVFMRDKGVHFIEFGLLGACFAHAVWVTWPGRGVRGAAAAWLFSGASGLLDELHQAYVPGRTADVRDLGADALGALLVIALVWIVRTLLARRAQRKAAALPPA